jgi:menaquinone-dependent protoporphyrinogen oxidase
MKVVVAAATRHGSTQMIADCIHEELEYSGCQAYLIDPDSLTSLAEYDAAVIGSAVYEGHWLKPARKLLQRLESELRNKPVWLFSSGPVGDSVKPEAPVEAAEISARIGAREHRVFAGRIERDQLSFGERLHVHDLDPERADDRDWIEIGRWARSIAAAVRTEEPHAATGARVGTAR